MINSFSKTDEFIKMINSLSKTDDFIIRCLEFKNYISVKINFKKMCFPGGFPWRVSLEGFPASFLTKSVDQLIQVVKLD